MAHTQRIATRLWPRPNSFRSAFDAHSHDYITNDRDVIVINLMAQVNSLPSSQPDSFQGLKFIPILAARPENEYIFKTRLLNHSRILSHRLGFSHAHYSIEGPHTPTAANQEEIN
ncbi:hypothetical protein Ddc_08010 [Ditylenchus destructor]|nr:hypothetical protein Ddc_08010 [Ditylenchus destructor]